MCVCVCCYRRINIFLILYTVSFSFTNILERTNMIAIPQESIENVMLLLLLLLLLLFLLLLLLI